MPGVRRIVISPPRVEPSFAGVNVKLEGKLARGSVLAKLTVPVKVGSVEFSLSRAETKIRKGVPAATTVGTTTGPGQGSAMHGLLDTISRTAGAASAEKATASNPTKQRKSASAIFLVNLISDTRYLTPVFGGGAGI